MPVRTTLKRQLHVHRAFAVQFLGIVVSAHGLYILASTLLVQVGAHRATRITSLVVDLPLLVGLSLLYLGNLVRRRKRTAWLVTVMAYTFYLGVSVAQLMNHMHLEDVELHELVRALVLPVAVLGLLFLFQKEFVVKSDIRGFGFAARFSVAVMLVAFLYGTAGFLLLDHSDFHQEIGLPTAAHYTVDQFNLTTAKPIHPYTRRAKLFVDSLSVVSLGALAYVAVSLFQPLRVRLTDQNQARERLHQLLLSYGGHSEDFFKLWPHDKQYAFDRTGEAGLAFHVNRGVALCLGDPAGNPNKHNQMLKEFAELCFGNDWLPALVHVESRHQKLYEKHGYTLQKLGEEAVVDIAHFTAEVAGNKYFRQIRNKFERHGYSYEVVEPPHHAAMVDRLKAISDEWLKQDGRVERGFVMGYFTPEYMQLCRLLVARDAAGTIQAFINVVPADFDAEEATFDMLRQSGSALGNVNDYVLMNLIDYLQAQGYRRLNLGLCPLVGLDEPTDEQNRLIGSFMKFAYVNGDRFYSFKGLYKFKAKYEPAWRDRHLAYQGGLRGFTRTIAALMRTMRV